MSLDFLSLDADSKLTFLSSPYRFPPPPPTSNQLSQKQKAQLRRSSKKLSKILGATPQFVSDASVSDVHLPLSRSRTNAGISHWRSKSDKLSLDYPSGPSRASSSTSAVALTSSSPRQLRRRSTSIDEARPHRPETPVTSLRPQSSLRATSVQAAARKQKQNRHATVLANVITVPSIPPMPSSSSSSSGPSSPNRSESGSSSATSPTRDSVCDSLYDPQFIIPTEASMRRAKMSRVTKLLGDGVPVDMVFRDEDEENDDDNDAYQARMGSGLVTRRTVAAQNGKYRITIYEGDSGQHANSNSSSESGAISNSNGSDAGLAQTSRSRARFDSDPIKYSYSYPSPLPAVADWTPPSPSESLPRSAGFVSSDPDDGALSLCSSNSSIATPPPLDEEYQFVHAPEHHEHGTSDDPEPQRLHLQVYEDGDTHGPAKRDFGLGIHFSIPSIPIAKLVRGRRRNVNVGV